MPSGDVRTSGICNSDLSEKIRKHFGKQDALGILEIQLGIDVLVRTLTYRTGTVVSERQLVQVAPHQESGLRDIV